jgi:hypothetical protein
MGSNWLLAIESISINWGEDALCSKGKEANRECQECEYPQVKEVSNA